MPALAVARTCRANRFQATDCAGEFRRVGEGGVAAGELVQPDYDRVRQAEANRVIAGVALAPGRAGSVVPVATAGQVAVAKTTAAVPMGAVLRPGADQPQRVEASGGSAPPIGFAATDAPAGTATVMAELRLTAR